MNGEPPTQRTKEQQGTAPRCGIHHCVMDRYEECHRCGGDGDIWVDDDPGMSSHHERCWNCRGTGEEPLPSCGVCVDEGDDF